MKRIDIHYSTLIFFLLYILSGMFRNVLILFSIIFIHEMGHLIISIIFGYNIKCIHFYPYGGFIEYDDDINKPIIYDFLVSIAGVIFQSLYYFIFIFLYKLYIIRDSTFIIFCNYHFSILLFNLLPIYPLDGAKILNLLINKFLPFKVSHILSIIISLILLIVLLIYFNNLNYVLIGVLLIQKIFVEIKYHKYIFNKFLLERNIKNFGFCKTKKINGFKYNKMFRDYEHCFIIHNNNISEKTALNLRFKIDR